jgi:hypothetical protein
MLIPSHTPISAVSGGFSVPNDETHSNNAMPPRQNNAQIILETKFLGRVSRCNAKRPETMTNASPVKNNHRTPTDETLKPTINNVWLVTNLMVVFFMVQAMPNAPRAESSWN